MWLINKDYFKVYIDFVNYFLKKDVKWSIEYVIKVFEFVFGKNLINF